MYVFRPNRFDRTSIIRELGVFGQRASLMFIEREDAQTLEQSTHLPSAGSKHWIRRHDWDWLNTYLDP